jgi:hypothetical protein
VYQYYLYAEDLYGNSGQVKFPAAIIIDNAPPSAILDSVTPTSLSGAGAITVFAYGTDDVGIVRMDYVYLYNSAGTSVAFGRAVFQNGTDTKKLYATSISVPSGLAAGTYSLVATVGDWWGKTANVTIGTITIS